MAEIIVVGGINIDIEGAPHGTLLQGDSNPGKVNISLGGVGRNIVENLARLGEKPGMISLIGDDFMGENARIHLEKLGVDVSEITKVNGVNTGMYLSILNEGKDMELAICNMDILESITPEFLEKRLEKLNAAKIVGVDCNLTTEALEYITENVTTNLFLDPVSASKAVRVKSLIGKFHTIKPNKIEAELLSDMEIKDEESLRKAGRYFRQQGVKRVIISLGKDGAYYLDDEDEGIIPIKETKIVSATGAGDAFSAGILYGHVHEMTSREMVEFAMACSRVALGATTAVNPEMSVDAVKNK